MIVCFSGHRPNKLGGYRPNPVEAEVRALTRAKLIELKPEQCISGMALGFDMIGAELCIELDIPWIAAIPFKGQESIWPVESQDHYHNLLNTAFRIMIICPGGYEAKKLQIRNQWMSDHSDEAIVYWDGSPGGTKNFIDYALSKNQIIHFLKESI